MSDDAANEPKQPEKSGKKQKKRSITFAEMLDARGFSVPDEAFKMYKQLTNPFAVYVQQVRAAGGKEETIQWLMNLVNQNVGYYKRKLECLKLIAEYAHAKPGKLSAPTIPPEITPPPGTKNANENPYANMSTADLIAGLPTTDENFNSGPITPDS